MTKDIQRSNSMFLSSTHFKFECIKIYTLEATGLSIINVLVVLKFCFYKNFSRCFQDKLIVVASVSMGGMEGASPPDNGVDDDGDLATGHFLMCVRCLL